MGQQSVTQLPKELHSLGQQEGQWHADGSVAAWEHSTAIAAMPPATLPSPFVSDTGTAVPLPSGMSSADTDIHPSHLQLISVMVAACADAYVQVSVAFQ